MPDLLADLLTNKIIDANSNTVDNFLITNQSKRVGLVYPANTTLGALGGLAGVSIAATTISGIIDATEGNIANANTSTSGVNIGLISATANNAGHSRADFNPYVRARFRIDDNTSTRVYFGFAASNSIFISDTPLANGVAGFLVGYNTATANWSIFHNDAAGDVVTSDLATPTAKDTNWHTWELIISPGSFEVKLDNANSTIKTTDIPSSATNLYLYCCGQTSATVTRNFQIKYLWFKADK